MPKDKPKTKIAVSLPGGGLRSFAYLGGLEALKEENFEIEAIYAYSGGALSAAIYLLGLDFEQTFKRISGPLWYLALSKRAFKFKLKKLFGDIQIQSLPIPFYIQVLNFTTGKLEVISEGNLVEYLIATSNQLAHAPYTYQKNKYIDGGMVGSYGTEYMRSKGFRKILALNVGNTVTLNRTFVSKFQALLNITMQEHLRKDALICPPDLLIEDLATDLNSMSFKAPKKSYKLGYQRIKEKIPQIKKSLLDK